MSDTCQTDTCQTHTPHHIHQQRYHSTCITQPRTVLYDFTCVCTQLNGHTKNYIYDSQVHVCITHTRHNNKCGSGDMMLSQCPQVSPIYLVFCRTYGILLACSQHIAPTDHTARATATTQHTRNTNDANKWSNIRNTCVLNQKCDPTCPIKGSRGW